MQLPLVPVVHEHVGFARVVRDRVLHKSRDFSIRFAPNAGRPLEMVLAHDVALMERLVVQVRGGGGTCKLWQDTPSS